MTTSTRTLARRSAALLATAAATTGAVLAVTQPSTAAAQAPNQLQLTASAPTTSALFHPCRTCFEATRPEGAHIGGTEIDAGTLADAAGHTVGHYALQSVGVTPFGPNGPGELQLTATLVIGGSQLVVQGLEEPPLDGGIGAITGGTGRFRGARGQLVYTDNADGSTSLTIDLVP